MPLSSAWKKEGFNYSNSMTSYKQAWLEWRYMAKYRNPAYQFYLRQKDLIKAWWQGRHLRRAKRIATARHKADGRTYYVLPDDKGLPRAFNRSEIHLIQRAGLMDKKVTCVDLYREAMWIANQKTVK